MKICNECGSQESEYQKDRDKDCQCGGHFVSPADAPTPTCSVCGWYLDNGECDRCALRKLQSERIMPLIGPLLDAWEGTDMSFKSDMNDQYKSLHNALQNISKAVEQD